MSGRTWQMFREDVKGRFALMLAVVLLHALVEEGLYVED